MAKEEKELSPAAKYALIGTIVTAVVGLIGTGLTLYFHYLEQVEPLKISVHASETAEARQTLVALSASPSFTLPSPSVTLTLTAAPMHTSTPSVTPPFP